VRSQKKIQVFFYLIAILLSLFSSVPQAASASGFLVSSNPSSEQHLTDPPAEISLLFSVGTLPSSLKGDVISVTNSAGVAVDTGDTKTSGMTMTIGVRQDIHPDRYQVAYRYVCDDGHVLVGAYSFVLTKVDANVPSTSPTPSTAGGPAPKVTVTSSPKKIDSKPSPLESQAGSESTRPQSQASGVDSQNSSPVAIESNPTNGNLTSVWVLLGLACAIGLWATWVAVRRLVRRN
jgi:methionine-rich copper-binding protein CopC